jgi:proteasome lid subunit RPN8/RPN11
MLEHAQAELPNECCGVLTGVRAGDELIVHDCHPLKNEAASPTEYLAGESLFAVHKTMRERGHEIVAIYHSHPTSAAIPSKKDLERNYYGDVVVHFIIGLNDATPDVRGWWLGEQSYDSADWKILEGAK